MRVYHSPRVTVERPDISHSRDYLDFVMGCRSGSDKSTWDIVVGGVADDKVFRTIDLFFSGDIEKADALRRLAYEEPNDRIRLRSQKAIDTLLTFVGSAGVPRWTTAGRRHFR